MRMAGMQENASQNKGFTEDLKVILLMNSRHASELGISNHSCFAASLILEFEITAQPAMY